MTGRRAASGDWQIEVTEDCMGSGMCIATAPDYFHLVHGRSEPRTALVPRDDTVVAAADLCPMGAIEMRDAS